jgi:hypothetical protein
MKYMNADRKEQTSTCVKRVKTGDRHDRLGPRAPLQFTPQLAAVQQETSSAEDPGSLPNWEISMTRLPAGQRAQHPVHPQTAAKHAPEGEMSGPPLKTRRGIAALAVAALVGALPLEGCGNPGEGAAEIAPGSLNPGDNPAAKQNPGVEKRKSRGAAADIAPGKLIPRHGRGLN